MPQSRMIRDERLSARRDSKWWLGAFEHPYAAECAQYEPDIKTEGGGLYVNDVVSKFVSRARA